VETNFAPAPRAKKKELAGQVEAAIRNPVINGVLNTVSGFVAVLNEQRQILAVNDALLESLGVKDAGKVLGLRPGEAIRCVHAHEMEAGCGTSRFCSSCGAAIAMVASLCNHCPEERECAIVVERNGKKTDLYLRVRSCPIVLDGRNFLLLFLQDITAHQRRVALERAFFHDINNIISSLQIESQLLEHPDSPHIYEVANHIRHLVKLLGKEFRIQRAISTSDLSEYPLSLERFSVDDVFHEIANRFASHPAARSRSFDLPDTLPELELVTDFLLLMRIISNMVVNALEATPKGDAVGIWIEQDDETVTFCVWNGQAIPREMEGRIFERNFTTKRESGRGIGTFTMRFFAESCLGGQVDFETSVEKGTVFRLTLPK